MYWLLEMELNLNILQLFFWVYNGKERQAIYEGWSLFASDKKPLQLQADVDIQHFYWCSHPVIFY